MPTVNELQQQLDQLRQATSLTREIEHHMKTLEEAQNRRWERLRQVIQNAANQYITMRIDAVEESFRDKGAPLWLSVLITVGVTFIPVSALTATFLGVLTTSTKKLIARADRAFSKRDPYLEKIIESEFDFLSASATSPRALWAFTEYSKLSGMFKKTDEMVGRFAKRWEPEVANMFQDQTKNLAETLYKQPFQQESASMMSQTNAPIVVVTDFLNQWINGQVKTEDKSRELIRDRIRDLFDIATSREPAKEAKAKMEAASAKQFSFNPSRVAHIFFQEPDVEPLPTTNKEAMDQLTKRRDELVPEDIEFTTAPAAKDMQDLQLMIEMMIWAATYDFTTRPEEVVVGRHVKPAGKATDAEEIEGYMVMPAPLPDTLWERLISRYRDPDLNKTYKDAGSQARLGTQAVPYLTSKGRTKGEFVPFEPKARLSHYFSQELYPKLKSEHSEVVQKFRNLKGF